MTTRLAAGARKVPVIGQALIIHGVALTRRFVNSALPNARSSKCISR
jgi:hypothetical protein